MKGRCKDKLTNKTQPNHTAQTDNGQNGKTDPQRRRHVQTQPEEALVRGSDSAGSGIGGLEDPSGVAGGSVDFVPPAETDQATTGNVFEVVEVGGEDEEGDDEDEDTGCGG